MKEKCFLANVSDGETDILVNNNGFMPITEAIKTQRRDTSMECPRDENDPWGPRAPQSRNRP